MRDIVVIKEPDGRLRAEGISYKGTQWLRENYPQALVSPYEYVLPTDLFWREAEDVGLVVQWEDGHVQSLDLPA